MIRNIIVVAVGMVVLDYLFPSPPAIVIVVGWAILIVTSARGRRLLGRLRDAVVEVLS